jgi:hypothetical protein
MPEPVTRRFGLTLLLEPETSGSVVGNSAAGHCCGLCGFAFGSFCYWSPAQLRVDGGGAVYRLMVCHTCREGLEWVEMPVALEGE